MTRIYIREPRHMTKRELQEELKAVRWHIKNASFGSFELNYERELMAELDKRFQL